MKETTKQLIRYNVESYLKLHMPKKGINVWLKNGVIVKLYVFVASGDTEPPWSPNIKNLEKRARVVGIENMEEAKKYALSLVPVTHKIKEFTYNGQTVEVATLDKCRETDFLTAVGVIKPYLTVSAIREQLLTGDIKEQTKYISPIARMVAFTKAVGN